MRFGQKSPEIPFRGQSLGLETQTPNRRKNSERKTVRAAPSHVNRDIGVMVVNKGLNPVLVEDTVGIEGPP